MKLPAEVTGASFVPGNGDAVVTGTVATDVSGFDGQRVVSFNVASGQENSGKFEFELVMENHFSGSVSLEVVARSTDGTDIIDTNVGSHSFVIAPVADAPILEGGNVTIETGSEDGFDLSGTADPARVNLSAQYSDLSEVTVILILDQNSKGVAYNGATFNATNINVPANITLSGNQKYVLIDVAPSEDGSFAGDFDVLPNDNYSGTLDVSIIARSIESDNSFADSSKIDKTLTINPVADAPSANSADVVASDGVEGSYRLWQYS